MRKLYRNKEANQGNRPSGIIKFDITNMSVLWEYNQVFLFKPVYIAAPRAENCQNIYLVQENLVTSLHLNLHQRSWQTSKTAKICNKGKETVWKPCWLLNHYVSQSHSSSAHSINKMQQIEVAEYIVI